jgi:5-methylcytosine-specific restriction endonuclease McrA
MANQFTKDSIPRRQLAKQNGNVTYEGYKPCVKCGNIERYTSNGSCVKCEREKGLEKLLNDDLMAPYRTKEKQAKNREKRRETIRENGKKYTQTEKGKISSCVSASNRRARIKNQLCETADFEKIKQIYAECRRLSEETGIPHEVDHIIPIAKGGLHHQDNLQILTRFQNRSKGDQIL